MALRAARETVRVREVGPRDGLQMAKSIMPTTAKLAWIDAIAASGVRELEAASFVPASAMPQMADAAQIVRSVRTRHPGLRVVALAPNLRGAQDAAAAGAQVVVVPVSASQAHSRANVRRSREEQVAELGRIVAFARSLGAAAPRIEAGISTAFGCSLQGVVAESEVVALAGALAAAGADAIALADTLGYATPAHVRRLVKSVRAEIGAERFGNLHLHDTLGVALANVLAALEEGVRGFDARAGRTGRLSFRAGFGRQRLDRRPRLPPGIRRVRHRDRPRHADRRARAAERGPARRTAARARRGCRRAAHLPTGRCTDARRFGEER